ncbi:protein FAM91A1-like isoform X1 [Zingiber officinale]|uniref:protein FAM91A1-like isoform X1 n=2 Tax=Zingiber officinale TaxID=94328 RepID=UPI001C4D63AE|nr:protein FAM91A1-like isoform X1 [Zingiber officinale]XP_042448343.1 protein FAM91A1-like isoform X1 [Zingiber officinale]
MQHIPTTIEEQLLLKAIRDESPWENLPKRLQAVLASKEEWHRRIINHCIKKRLQWNHCFARKVCKEGEYYEEMMRYLRKNLALFPYHLAEYVCRVMRVSPFRYYCDMIFEVLKNEQPYDSIPNFSAADALRLTGIGRNEYIDIMNKCRSKKIMWKLNKSIAKELLPTQPVDFPIEPWWGVCLVNFTLEEFKKLTEEETATIDKVCKEEANSFVLFDPGIVRGLYRRGLIYFDIPVYPDDRFKVSRLEGFVSNREQSYEDPIEELLYAVFVVSSENATVAELAATLQADLSQLQAAASFACRLGWAVKLLDPESVLHDSSIHGLANNILSDDEEGSNVSISSEKSGQQNHGLVAEKDRTISGIAHVAFVVDANITSYLMMGSVSPGLKSHAVTLYEAGKLGDSSIAELCKDLSTLEGKKFEGELQEFANHAYSLRCVLECLHSGGIAEDDKNERTINSADTRLHQSGGVDNGDKNERAINQTGIQNYFVDATSSLVSEIEISDTNEAKIYHNVDSSTHSHTNIHRTDSSEECDGANVHLLPYSETSAKDNTSRQENYSPWDQKIPSLDGPENEKIIQKRKRKYRVDILRCESLASLAPATLDRLFLRDYDIIVSMVPLPASSVLPGSSGPFHFGPPSYSSMTPWMKLVLYTIVENGPISVVLMKGQCLRLLPAPLAGCEKALIWSWDGSTVGGLGGKFEGNLVNGNVLLHCLNSILKHSAVLVQPLSRYDLDNSGRMVTVDIALPLKNFDGSVQPVGSDMGLDPEGIADLNTLLEELSTKIELLTVGYIRLLRLRKVIQSEMFSSDDEKYEWVPLSLEFGIPLFNPKLCGRICERIFSSHLLQTDWLSEHHDAMQSLRKRLRELCSEYQATGPTAKLFYHIDRVRESPRHLISYASGKWSPHLDPSTPISAASSEHQRLKLVNRQRCRTEILSFDGNMLRSYALGSIYEAGGHPFEESTSSGGTKHDESDEDNSREVALPGVNLLFDGALLHPFDIGACLQARQPVLLIAEASSASTSMQETRTSL